MILFISRKHVERANAEMQTKAEVQTKTFGIRVKKACTKQQLIQTYAINPKSFHKRSNTKNGNGFNFDWSFPETTTFLKCL